MPNQAVTIYQRPTRVLNLRGGLPIVGHIKIGEKGEAIESRRGNWFQPPEKLNHFKITTLMRGADGNYLKDEALHAIYGPEPKELKVRLLYNDPELNFSHSYMAYSGKTPWCFGDGVTAWRLTGDDQGTRQQRSCMCEYYTDRTYTGDKKCKIAGRLSVVIDGAAQVGGVWDFRTGSINTVDGIQASLDMLMAATGGWVHGIPLLMTVRPQLAQLPSGKTSEIFVVRLQYNGSMEQLRDYALSKAEGDLKFGGRMKDIEARARKLLAPPSAEEDSEIVDEFFPGAAQEEIRRNGNGGNGGGDQGTSQGEYTPRTAAPTGGAADLVDVYDAEGEEHSIPPAEVDAWLIEQLFAIETIFQLNRFAAANEDVTNVAVAEKMDALRAHLLAKEGEAEGSPGSATSTVPILRTLPQAEEVPAARSAKRGGKKAAAVSEPNDGSGPKLDVAVVWPKQVNPMHYTSEEFPEVYRTRRQYGGESFEATFRKNNPEVWAKFAEGLK